MAENKNVYTIILDAIHEDVSEQDLKWTLQDVGAYGKDWIICYFIPQETNHLAQIKCHSKRTRNKILELCKDYITERAASEGRRSEESVVAESPGTILMLPPECLETIIKMCPLKDQIQLAKVCQQFYHILQRIWSIRYYSFTYSILELKYKQDWNELEIRDACMLFGRHVRILCFCTMFRSDMLVEIQRYDGWNPIERLKRYLNLNFISNLKYFENVEEFEIRGKLINDFVIEALAYKCKHLRSVKFLNGTTQSCVGSFLHKLTNLHTLEIPASRNIGPASLMLCSEKNPLRYLNIVECKLLEDVPIMISLCHYWRNITTLRLTAFSSSYEYIAAIFNLNTLKDLQMYWTKNPFEDFVESFLHQLQLHDEKCMKLQLISFETDRYNIEDTSNVDWTPFTYARMRELVCINGTPWVWSPEFLALLTPYFRSFANLKELHFVYARLLPYELLKQIPVINRNIQLILVQGCPYKCDQLFAREWERIFPKCHLRFQSVLNAHQAEQLRDSAHRPYETVKNPETVMRSIRVVF